MIDKQPRGLRNNNPGNIRDIPPDMFQGQTGNDPDGYAVFSHVSWGLRAMFIILRNYQTRDDCRSIKDIIYRWDGARDSDVAQYASFVADFVHLTPTMDFLWGAYTIDLVRAMVHFENGTWGYSDIVFTRALSLAFYAPILTKETIQ